MFYDLSQKLGVDYEILKEYFKYDPLQVYRYASPVHDSGHTLGKFGRGAGGHCFIKDFKAFKNIMDEKVNDKNYSKLLGALEQKNIDLLVKSKKDLDLLSQVYGSGIIESE
jgi:UDP-glucose 6-dehydrogenase